MLSFKFFESFSFLALTNLGLAFKSSGKKIINQLGGLARLGLFVSFKALKKFVLNDLKSCRPYLWLAEKAKTNSLQDHPKSPCHVLLYLFYLKKNSFGFCSCSKLFQLKFLKINTVHINAYCIAPTQLRGWLRWQMKDIYRIHMFVKMLQCGFSCIIGARGAQR